MKKIFLCVIGIIIIISIMLFLRNNSGTKENFENNDEIISVEDERGYSYFAIYNEDNFVYEIYDENNKLLFVCSNKEDIGNYLKETANVDIIEYNE